MKRADLLRLVRDGKSHPHANRLLAPLAAAGLIHYDATPPLYRARNVRLTTAGAAWLRFQEEKTCNPEK